LTSVFERNIVDSNKNTKLEQIRKEEEYVQKIKGLYKFITLATLSLIVPLILGINDAANWPIFLWILFSWAVIIAIYSLNVFDFFGEEWKRKLIQRKFNKK
jgi:hypothetical protein